VDRESKPTLPRCDESLQRLKVGRHSVWELVWESGSRFARSIVELLGIDWGVLYL
jgi:hypothetical protein